MTRASRTPFTDPALVARVLAACALAFAPTAHGTRDPMRPPLPAAERTAVRAARAPDLSAVIGSGERRVAVVNGRVVRAGDTVDGALILAVFDDGVRYSRAGVARELRLPPAATVKRPAQIGPAGPRSGK